MKKCLSASSFVLLICFIVGCQDKEAQVEQVKSPSQSEMDVVAAKREIEEVMLQNEIGMINKDIETLENNWADQYILTIPTGVSYTKSEYIARLKSDEVEYLDIKSTDTEIRISGDTAVVTGQIISRIKIRGEELSLQPARFTSTFVKRNGRWQIIARHECRIEQRQ